MQVAKAFLEHFLTDQAKKTSTAAGEVNAINAVLPQTQCGECGYSGCLPYAQALAQKKTTIDRCPPGGVTTLQALAALLQVDHGPYLAAVKQKWRSPAVAFIRENECIGCTKCIQACPVDAIIGSGKLMHTVLSEECTGCGLCLAPCPVDCIEMVSIPLPLYDKEVAQQRYQARQARLTGEKRAQQHAYHEKRILAKTPDNPEDKAAKNTYILAALARVQAKKNNE